MIRGWFAEAALWRRPFVSARLTLPDHNLAGDVYLLVDTGADITLLSPGDARRLGLDSSRLIPSMGLVGVGGLTRIREVKAALRLGTRQFDLTIHVMIVDGVSHERNLQQIPSLLGRDVLAHFALFLEERTRRVLLLDPHEVEGIALP